MNRKRRGPGCLTRFRSPTCRNTRFILFGPLTAALCCVLAPLSAFAQPCSINLTNLAGPAVSVHCSADLDSVTVFKCKVTPSSIVHLRSLTLDASTPGGGGLLAGSLICYLGGEAQAPVAISPGQNKVFGGSRVIAPGSPLTIEVRTTAVPNPQGNASLSLALPTAGKIIFDEVCSVTGVPMDGPNLRIESRRPSPLCESMESLPPDTIWCGAADQAGGTTGLQFQLGEGDEAAYFVTHLTIAQATTFAYVDHVTVYRDDIPYLTGRPDAGSTTVDLSGTPIPVSRDQSLTAYDVRYFWSAVAPLSPLDHAPRVTSVSTDAAAYCNGIDPFAAIINAPGRSMTRAPGGQLSASLASDSPTSAADACSGALEEDGYRMLKASLDNSSTLQAMKVFSVTLEITGGNFGLFDWIQIRTADDSTYVEDNPGAGSEATVTTAGFTVPPGDASAEVWLKPLPSMATELSIRIRVKSIAYAGAITSVLTPDPCSPYPEITTTEWGCPLRILPTPALSVPEWTQTPDIADCSASPQELVQFTLQASGSDEGDPVFDLLSYEFVQDAGSVSRVRLYKGTGDADFVDDTGLDGTFDAELAAKNWTLTSAGQAFRLEMTPEEDESAEVQPKITVIGATDPDGCVVSPLRPEHTGATLRYGKQGELAVSRSDIPTASGGERTVCMTAGAGLLHPMLQLALATGASEAADLLSLTLGCNRWQEVSSVAAYTGVASRSTSWDAASHTLTFDPALTIPSSPGALALDLEFLFSNPQVDFGYQASIDSVEAKGTSTGYPPFHCGALTQPAGLPSQEPSFLTFRVPGALTRTLNASFPSDDVIPSSSGTRDLLRFTLAASERETIRVQSLEFRECGNPDPLPLSSYLTENASLIANGVPVAGSAVVQQTLRYIPADLQIAPGESLECVLRGAFHLRNSDTGNVPLVKISAPECTAEGTITGSRGCVLVQAAPDAVCPGHGFDAEIVGTVPVDETARAPEDDIYCEREGLLAAFSLATTREEEGTLSSLTVSVTELDTCSGGFAGQARLVEDTDGDGTWDEGAETSVLSGPAPFTKASGATFSFTEGRQLSPTPLSVLALITLDRNSACAGRRIRGTVGATGVSALGAQTGAFMHVTVPAAWQRTVIVLPEPVVGPVALIEVTGCDDEPALSLPPDSGTRETSVGRLDLRASGLDRTLSLIRLDLDWHGDNPESVFSAVRCKVGSMFTSGAMADHGTASFLFSPPVDFPVSDSVRSFEILLTPRSGMKSGTYSLTATADSSHMVFVSGADSVAFGDADEGAERGVDGAASGAAADWSCPPGSTCSCGTRRITFENSAAISLCSCSGTLPNVVWGKGGAADAFSFSLQRTASDHMITLERIAFPLEEGASGLVRNLASGALWTGCSGSERIDGSSAAIEADSLVVRTSYSIDDSTARTFLLRLTGKGESDFVNADRFTLGTPRITATDLVHDRPAHVQTCAQQPEGPSIKPRIAGWAALDGSVSCEARSTDPQAWARFYHLRLRAEKEDLTPKTLTIPFDPTRTTFDASMDTVLFRVVDESDRPVTLEKTRWQPGSHGVQFTDFAPVTLGSGEDFHDWHVELRIAGTPSAGNKEKALTIDERALASGLRFTGRYTTPAELEVRTLGSLPECSFRFEAGTFANVRHCSARDPVSVSPFQQDIPVFADSLRVEGGALRSLYLKQVTYTLLRRPAQTASLDQITFQLMEGQSSTVVSTGRIEGNVVTFPITESSHQVFTSDGIQLQVRMNVRDVDTGETIQIGYGSLGSYIITDAPGEIGARISASCEGDESGPLITFRAGPCSTEKGTGFARLPRAAHSGVRFPVEVGLYDASGVANAGSGNPLSGVPRDQLSFAWISGAQETPLVPLDSSEAATGPDGHIRLFLAIERPQDTNSPEITLRCRTGEACRFETRISLAAGKPDSARSWVESIRDGNTDVLHTRLHLFDRQGSPLEENTHRVQVADVADAGPGLHDPIQGGTAHDWLFSRDGHPGNALVRWSIEPADSAYGPQQLLMNVRVPEYIAPTFRSDPEVVLHEGQITVHVEASDNNARDREELRFYFLLRKGWSAGPADTSRVRRNTEALDPTAAITWNETFTLPADHDSLRSIDWRVALVDRDQNTSYFPSGGCACLNAPVASRQRIFTEPVPQGWHLFSIPDSFPGLYPGPPNGIFSGLFGGVRGAGPDEWTSSGRSSTGWSIAEYRGGGAFAYCGSDGVAELARLARGRGYWIKETASAPAIILRNGCTTGTECEQTVPLRKGDFTAIGNPFAFPLTAGDLARAVIRFNGQERRLLEGGQWVDWISFYEAMPLSAGDGGYAIYGVRTGDRDPATWSLDPWGAQYAYLSPVGFLPDEGIELAFRPPEPLTYPLAAGQTGREASHESAALADAKHDSWSASPAWRIVFSLGESGGTPSRQGARPTEAALPIEETLSCCNSLVLCGFTGASASLDSLDRAAPPWISPPETWTLRALADESGPHGFRMPLFLDARPFTGEAQSPEFLVTAIGGRAGPAHLSWTEPDLPPGWGARLVDELGSRVIDVARDRELVIAFLGQAVDYRLRLVVAPENGIDEALERIIPLRPLELELRPIMPNPAAGMTRIIFGIPSSGPVDLAIFDVRGRRVRQILSGAEENAGPHTILWDGRDDEHRQVAAGVYWAEIRHSGDAKQQQVVIVR